MSSLVYRFPNGTRIVLNENNINSPNPIVQAYRGGKPFILPLWVEDALVKALSYSAMGKLCLRYLDLPTEIKSTLPTRIYTEAGEKVHASVGGLI